MISLQHASLAINGWVERSLAYLGVTMAAVVALQVFCRYILNSSLFWSEEMARYLLVWMSFLGATAAYHRGLHPGIDIITARLQGPALRVCRLAVHLVCLGFFLVMVYHGIVFAYFVRLQISPALSLPKWLIFSIIPLSGTIFLLHGLNFLLNDLRGATNGH